MQAYEHERSRCGVTYPHTVKPHVFLDCFFSCEVDMENKTTGWWRVCKTTVERRYMLHWAHPCAGMRRSDFATRDVMCVMAFCREEKASGTSGASFFLTPIEWFQCLLAWGVWSKKSFCFLAFSTDAASRTFFKTFVTQCKTSKNTRSNSINTYAHKQRKYAPSGKQAKIQSSSSQKNDQQYSPSSHPFVKQLSKVHQHNNRNTNDTKLTNHKIGHVFTNINLSICKPIPISFGKAN